MLKYNIAIKKRKPDYLDHRFSDTDCLPENSLKVKSPLIHSTNSSMMNSSGGMASSLALALLLFVAISLFPSSNSSASAKTPLSGADATKISIKSEAASNEPDYEKAGKEALEHLSGYLRIDTTVPPGNEAKGAAFLKSILEKNGIEAELIETAPNRACLYARLKGNGKKKAVILLNHIDVVPAEAKDWKYPPFGGEIHEGEIWGRGALDMKGMAIVELEAMLLLKRGGVELDRDIIFLATPDEEVGGEFGAGWLVKNRPDLFENAEFLLNEGFVIEAPGGKPIYWGVNFAEKSPLWLQVKTRGEAGHASMPLASSATKKLVAALARIEKSGPDFKLLAPVKEYFETIAPLLSDKNLQEAYADISLSVKDKSKESILLADVLKSSMLRDTISLTVLKAGYKTNVIPAEAIAELDCRLLPGVSESEFVERLKRIVDDADVEISIIDWNKAEPSPLDTELFTAIKKTAARESPGVPVVPVVVPWFTDSHWFRNLGITAYGFMPFELDEKHMATMHGKNERIPVKAVYDGVRRMHKILLELSLDNR